MCSYRWSHQSPTLRSWVVPLTLSFDCGLDTPIPTFCAWIAVENKMATSTLEPPVITRLFFMINKVHNVRTFGGSVVAECLFDTEQSQEYLAQPYQIMLQTPIAPSY